MIGLKLYAAEITLLWYAMDSKKFEFQKIDFTIWNFRRSCDLFSYDLRLRIWWYSWNSKIQFLESRNKVWIEPMVTFKIRPIVIRLCLNRPSSLVSFSSSSFITFNHIAAVLVSTSLFHSSLFCCSSSLVFTSNGFQIIFDMYTDK